MKDLSDEDYGKAIQGMMEGICATIYQCPEYVEVIIVPSDDYVESFQTYIALPIHIIMVFLTVKIHPF